MHHRYFVVNKPYNMLSQFISEKADTLLTGIQYNFPEGIHAVGRLDKHSEGLLILTNNKKVTRLLFQDDVPHKRVYVVAVKNKISETQLQQLRTGISIRIKGGEQYITTSCEADLIEKPAGLFARTGGPQERLQQTWLRIALTEGKFRQVRKMIMAIHNRCQRLIRISIEDVHLNNLQPGEVRELTEDDFFRLLKIDYSINSAGAQLFS